MLVINRKVELCYYIKKSLVKLLNSFGRGTKTRTQPSGFGDRHATTNTIPLKQLL